MPPLSVALFFGIHFDNRPNRVCRLGRCGHGHRAAFLPPFGALFACTRGKNTFGFRDAPHHLFLFFSQCPLLLFCKKVAVFSLFAIVAPLSPFLSRVGRMHRLFLPATLKGSTGKKKTERQKDAATPNRQPARACPPPPLVSPRLSCKKKKQGANRAPATKHHPPQKAKGNKTKHTRKRHTPNTLPAGAARFFAPSLCPFVSVSFFPVSMFVWALVSPES